jgi:hypothetical protein
MNAAKSYRNLPPLAGLASLTNTTYETVRADLKELTGSA